MTSGGRLLAVCLPELPEVRPTDDLGALVVAAWRSLAAAEPDLAPRASDVLVVTQKVVSKAEGRIVRLSEVEPRPEAVAFAEQWGHDPRQLEVVLRESAQVLRMERGVVISRTHHGFVCANAGVDASNMGEGDVVTLLPADPDASARAIRERIAAELGVAVGVVISDSFGRPWRWGITDVALGVAGFLPLDDLRGTPDTAGRVMRATVVAVADEIASAAELASGKTSRRPLVLVRGAHLPPGEGSVVRDVGHAPRGRPVPVGVSALSAGPAARGAPAPGALATDVGVLASPTPGVLCRPSPVALAFGDPAEGGREKSEYPQRYWLSRRYGQAKWLGRPSRACGA